MAVNYTDVQKTEKYISRTNFDALEMAAVPEGTEFNIVDQIHESDLDSDVLQKLNNNAKINTANTFTAAQTFKKDISIEGNIIQNGSAYETHAEKLYTKNDMIYTRDGATAALADNAYTGIQAVKYDGTNDGQLVFGKDGVARVGDVGNTQPLATRAEKGALTDGHLLQWDAAGQTLVDSGKSVSDLEGGGGDVTAAGNNTFTGSNTFNKDVVVNTANLKVIDEVSGNKSTLTYDTLTLESVVNDDICMLDTGGLVHKNGATSTTLAFENNGLTTTLTVPNKTGTLALSEDVFKLNGENTSSAINTYSGAAYFNASTHFTNTPDFQSGKIQNGAVILTFPKKSGTIALTGDVPVIMANPISSGTATLTKLRIDDVVYTIPSGGGSGDVTAAGNNVFTGSNEFTGKSTFTGNIDFIGPNIFYKKLQVSDLTGNIGSKDYGIFLSAMDGIKCVAPEGDSTTSYKQFTLNSEYVEFHAGDIVYTQKLKTATPLSQNSVLKLPDKAIGTLATTDDIPITSATLSDNGTTLTLVLR